MKINCIIIDDEPLAAEVIATHLSEFSNMELIGTFTNPMLALGVIESGNVDAVFGKNTRHAGDNAGLVPAHEGEQHQVLVNDPAAGFIGLHPQTEVEISPHRFHGRHHLRVAAFGRAQVHHQKHGEMPPHGTGLHIHDVDVLIGQHAGYRVHQPGFVLADC